MEDSKGDFGGFQKIPRVLGKAYTMHTRPPFFVGPILRLWMNREFIKAAKPRRVSVRVHVCVINTDEASAPKSLNIAEKSKVFSTTNVCSGQLSLAIAWPGICRGCDPCTL